MTMLVLDVVAVVASLLMIGLTVLTVTGAIVLIVQAYRESEK